MNKIKFEHTLCFYAILDFSHFLQIIFGYTLKDITLIRSLYTTYTFAGLRNAIGLGLGFFILQNQLKKRCKILLKRDANIFITVRYLSTSKSYMRCMCLKQVFLYRCQRQITSNAATIFVRAKCGAGLNSQKRGVE